MLSVVHVACYANANVNDMNMIFVIVCWNNRTFMIDILLLILYIDMNNEHILIGTMLRVRPLLSTPIAANLNYPPFLALKSTPPN